jgi:hypothetical protein
MKQNIENMHIKHSIDYKEKNERELAFVYSFFTMEYI